MALPNRKLPLQFDLVQGYGDEADSGFCAGQQVRMEKAADSSESAAFSSLLQFWW
jgi:hypothetical protein